MCSIAFPQESTATTAARISQLTTDDEPRTTRPQSTGPRTPAGKARSSQNARKHNLSATTPPPDLLQNPTYQILHQELIEEFQPNTPVLSILVSQLTFISWKLDQIPKLEHQLLATPLGETTPTPLSTTTVESPDDYLAHRLADDSPPPPDTTNQLTAQHLLQDKPTPLTRLWDHHRRLLSRFQSLVRQIQQMKRQQQSRLADQARQRAEQKARDHIEMDRIIDNMRQRHRQEQLQRQTAARQNELPPSPISASADAQSTSSVTPTTSVRHNPTCQKWHPHIKTVISTENPV
jgi:hypothetical protein